MSIIPSKQPTEEAMKKKIATQLEVQDRKYTDLLRYLWKPKFLESRPLERPLGLEAHSEATLLKWLSDELDEFEAVRVNSANALWNRLSELDDIVGIVLELRTRQATIPPAMRERLRLVTAHVPYFSGIGELYFALRVLKSHFRAANMGQ